VLAVARFGDVTRADFRARFDGVVVVRAIDAFDRFRAARLVATFTARDCARFLALFVAVPPPRGGAAAPRAVVGREVRRPRSARGVLPGAARDARRDLRGGRLRGTARSGQKGSANRSHGTVRLGT
jgi:hypothetical protein